MKLKLGMLTTAALCVGMATSGALAATGIVTPDVIYGSGNANGSFTIGTSSNVEVGLRGHLRYNNSGVPQNIFNWDGINTYTFNPSDGNPPATRSLFNFDWSINTNVDGTGSNTIGSFDYLLQIDTDPSVLTNFISGDPYALGGDHSFGDNSTGNGAGVEAGSPAQYLAFLGLYNVSQQSWNMGFGDLNGGLPYLSDPHQEGLYTIALSVLEKGTSNVVASTSINIQYGATAPVPLPAGLPLLMGAFGGLALLSRRRRKA